MFEKHQLGWFVTKVSSGAGFSALDNQLGKSQRLTVTVMSALAKPRE